MKPGDIVYLKSGSPPLTVEEVVDDGALVFVTWFSGTERREAGFDPAMLEGEDE